jgi:hypothetical protein
MCKKSEYKILASGEAYSYELSMLNNKVTFETDPYVYEAYNKNVRVTESDF